MYKDLSKLDNSQFTNDILIFPLSHSSSKPGFSIGNYNLNLIEGRISMEDANMLLNEVNTFVEDYFRTFGRIFTAIITLLVTSVIAIVGIANTMGSSLSIFRLHFAMEMLIFTAIISIKILEKVYKTRLLNIANECVINHNEIIARSGLKWKLPKEFPNSIELRRDYIVQEMTEINRKYHPIKMEISYDNNIKMSNTDYYQLI